MFAKNTFLELLDYFVFQCNVSIVADTKEKEKNKVEEKETSIKKVRKPYKTEGQQPWLLHTA